MSEEQGTAQPGCDEPWSGEERRSDLRRRCRGNTVAQFVIRPSFRCFRVTLWDASPRGISFLHDAPLAQGTILGVQLGVGRSDASYVRAAHVVHATPRMGKWLIGCRLSPPLSSTQLDYL